MKTKICTKCRSLKNINEFHKDKNRKDGFSLWCKKCANKSAMKWEKQNKRKYREYQKNYKLLHKKERITYDKKYRQINKQKRRKYGIIYENQRRKTDIVFKILCNLRNRILCAIKRNYKSKKTVQLIGCSIGQLKDYLGNKFTKDMTWTNYGKWHIDHIRPCCSFDLSKAREQYKCFNYTNLQPLWAKDNLKKGVKYEKNI